MHSVCLMIGNCVHVISSRVAPYTFEIIVNSYNMNSLLESRCKYLNCIPDCFCIFLNANCQQITSYFQSFEKNFFLFESLFNGFSLLDNFVYWIMTTHERETFNCRNLFCSVLWLFICPQTHFGSQLCIVAVRNRV